ncbi:MAG: stage II sporulation protein M [Bacilli bacterium]|nr:stage II sporulation protein M [Bacilli bacterium]
MIKELNKYKGLSRRKIFIILLVICIISFIFGILFLALLDKNGKSIVVSTINNYINNLNYNKKDLFLLFKNNVLITIIMFLFGVSLFGVIFEILFLIAKSFVLGFSISSFIYTFKVKGILIGLIYLFPNIFNLFIYFILGFFALNYSIYLYKYLFKNKEYNLKSLMKKYLKVLGVSIILLSLSSLIQYFIIPYILKLFTNS